jgi:two-component system KDP operon response regulator KdpE
MNNIAKAILILDDEAPVSWALKSILGMENYQVFIASTLEEAGHISDDEALSAVITEYRLDRDYTVETIKKLKETLPGLYIMMLTNNEVDEREYEEIIRAGVDDYFLKPFSFNRILLHLEKGLKRVAC